MICLKLNVIKTDKVDVIRVLSHNTSKIIAIHGAVSLFSNLAHNDLDFSSVKKNISIIISSSMEKQKPRNG